MVILPSNWGDTTVMRKNDPHPPEVSSTSTWVALRAVDSTLRIRDALLGAGAAVATAAVIERTPRTETLAGANVIAALPVAAVAPRSNAPRVADNIVAVSYSSQKRDKQY